MKLLTREAILAAEDIKIDTVTVPEWPDAEGQPGLVRLRQMSAEESMGLTRLMVGDAGKDGMYIMLVASAIDEEGNPLFTMEDVPALRKKNFKVLDRLQRIALSMNSMLGDSGVALKKD